MLTFIQNWILELPRYEPTLIGINGPQGSGKSTLTRSLVESLAQQNIRAVTLSIDDFYLTREEQVKLAQAYPDNPYLQQRGYPGTHDIQLGRQTMEKLKKIKGFGTVACPAYEKSLHQGQGDRLPRQDWKTISAPLDFVFIEGWMLGFQSIEPEKLKIILVIRNPFRHSLFLRIRTAISQ